MQKMSKEKRGEAVGGVPGIQWNEEEKQSVHHGNECAR